MELTCQSQRPAEANRVKPKTAHKSLDNVINCILEPSSSGDIVRDIATKTTISCISLTTRGRIPHMLLCYKSHENCSCYLDKCL